MSGKPPRQAPLPPELYDETYFLTACEGYDEFLKTEGEHLSRRLRQAFEFAAVEPGMCVLDLGCGRGEIVRQVARLGARVFGIDYAPAAVRLTHRIMRGETGTYGVARADAKALPFADDTFDRVLMFDVVEHLHPWELEICLGEVWRVLKQGGQIVIHTAPNRWYDAYAYPLVRLFRTLMGQGARYPRNPRALNVAVNTEVHVNEQDILRLRRHLQRARFRQVRVWLDTPPQQRSEGAVLDALRHIAFNWIPFAWFFQREVFAVGAK
ncbi:MAG: methyltransferase domain-containing protein, partial [Anaerolineae bacterium]|nr:methyltransferase domain-containing protein [Thermoflexales bacterium]MDW8394912.1 methyltransferase domain-containing protein [Anaerolineae bacterium]